MSSESNIEVRDLRFPLESVPRHWHPAGRGVSAWFDQLSIFFPVGEAFFVRSVRHYASRVQDPKLAADVAAFCAQEGHHGREHRRYNERLAGFGLPVAFLERVVRRLLGLATVVLSPRKQLAVTCALEHFTSLMGEFILVDPRGLEGADDTMARLWRWHAAEENEHRDVAFDVYRAVGGTWFERCRLMVLTTVFFWALVCVHNLVFLWKQGDLFSPRECWRLLRFSFVTPNAVGRLVRPYLAYFARDFHPSARGGQHELLTQWKATLPTGAKATP